MRGSFSHNRLSTGERKYHLVDATFDFFVPACSYSCLLYFAINACSLHFRKKPAHQRVLELGMPESSRKFISCVRKYLIFYLTLCEEAEDLGTLERAYTCLKADRKVNYHRFRTFCLSLLLLI